jgi:hypothetical protein
MIFLSLDNSIEKNRPPETPPAVGFYKKGKNKKEALTRPPENGKITCLYFRKGTTIPLQTKISIAETPE